MHQSSSSAPASERLVSVSETVGAVATKGSAGTVSFVALALVVAVYVAYLMSRSGTSDTDDKLEFNFVDSLKIDDFQSLQIRSLLN